MGSDKPPLERRGGVPTLTTIAEILGNIWNTSGFSIVSAHSLYRLLILKDFKISPFSLVSLYNRLSAQGAGTKESRSKVTERERERDVLFPFQMALQLISINSLPLSSLPKINPSQLKDGGEWRKKKRQGTRATAGPFYLMERGEQTEGLASMR